MFIPGTNVRSIHRIHYTGQTQTNTCPTCNHKSFFLGSIEVPIDTPGVVTELHMVEDRQTEVWVKFEGHAQSIRMTLNSMIGIREED